MKSWRFCLLWGSILVWERERGMEWGGIKCVQANGVSLRTLQGTAAIIFIVAVELIEGPFFRAFGWRPRGASFTRGFRHIHTNIVVCLRGLPLSELQRIQQWNGAEDRQVSKRHALIPATTSGRWQSTEAWEGLCQWKKRGSLFREESGRRFACMITIVKPQALCHDLLTIKWGLRVGC